MSIYCSSINDDVSKTPRWQLTVNYIYTVSRKNKTSNSCPYLRQILIDFKKSFTVTLSKKCAIKRTLQNQPHLKGVATLPCEILVSQKPHQLKAQQQQTRCARTVKECDRGRWAKQLWPDKNSPYSTSNSTICGRTDHFLHGDLGLKSSKRCLLKNWLKQTPTRDSAAQNSCRMMLSLFGLVMKAIHISSTEKFTEWPTASICCNKE